MTCLTRCERQTKELNVSFEDYSSGGLATGAASGAALAALISWLSYRNKKQPEWKKWLKGIGWTALGSLLGGAAGSYAGRMYSRHKTYNEIRDAIRNDAKNSGSGKRTGRVLYIDADRNVHNAGKNEKSIDAAIARRLFPKGVPIGHGMLATIDDETGDMKIYSVGVAGVGRKDLANQKGWDVIRSGIDQRDASKTIDGMKKMLALNEGMLPRLDVMEYKGIGKLDDKGLAEFLGKKMREKGYGDSLTLYEGERGIDIGMPQKFFLRNYLSTFKPGNGGYGYIPGGFNCGTAAREAFDAFQPSQTSHWLDMLWGGGGTANAPSHARSWNWTYPGSK